MDKILDAVTGRAAAVLAVYWSVVLSVVLIHLTGARSFVMKILQWLSS